MSRADEMPTFVKISCSAAEGRVVRDPVFLLLSFSDIFGLVFYWPAAEFVVVALAPLRPFRHFAQKSLKTQCQNGIFVRAQIRACAAAIVDGAFVPLRPFARFWSSAASSV